MNIKSILKETAIITLVIGLLLILISCGSSKLTMYVGLGNNGTGYYEELKDEVKKNTGVDIELVYTASMDGSNAMVSRIENDDLPADIVITASKTDGEICKKSLLDLGEYTTATDSFTINKINELSNNGAIYQLPYTSRLIGIEYNETLMSEMGWELPNNYQDMLELKSKADAAGIPFAVSGGAATGHGFNYLFHTMGTEYLSNIDGTEWLTKYRKGETSVDSFAAKSTYFQKYADAGLFGKVVSDVWDASTEYSETRALFYYNIINNVYKYDGYKYTQDGRIEGAAYDANGNVVANKSKDGEAVLLDGKYVLYDENNDKHKGLDRYTIPGAIILHDTYGSIPWISEYG